MLARTAHPLHDAALIALQVPLRYAQQGRHLAWAAIGGARTLQTGRHHPEHDVVDRRAGTRFYYHAHPIEGGEAEHGHFHVFHEQGPTLHHLAALSLDALGRPVRWFCTSPWVTGESWPPPADLSDKVAGFQVSTRGKMAPVARWLQAMFALYRDDLRSMIEARDRLLAEPDLDPAIALDSGPGRHVLTSRPIDLGQRVQQILNTTGEDT